MKRIILSISVFFAFIFSSFAQFSNINSYVTRSWTSADGLPGNSISDILQSKNGYMYFGTYECLVKFDGYDFTNINKYTNPDYSFISARSIFEDSKGNLWIGSNDEGVQKIGNSSIEIFDVHKGLPSNSVRDFVEDKYHNVWIGTAAGVVYITPDGNVKVPSYQTSENIEHVIVNQLFCDSANRIWMLTNDVNGLYIYSGNSFQHYDELLKFGDFIPSSIVQDRNGDIWIGLSTEGLVKISNGSISKVVTNTVADYEPTNCMLCDSTGALWFGSERGIVLFKDGTYSEYEDSESISTGSINSIFEDREGNIWIGTANKGLSKVSPGKFRMNRLTVSVNAICEDSKGLIWIGTDDGLICYENDVQIENILTETCKGIRIRHIGLTENGDILVNCYTKPGLIRYDGNSIVSWSTDEGLAGNKTRVSIELSNGDVYVGTTTGLSIIKKDNSIKNITVTSGFENEYIMCLYEDNDGYVWVGTDGGGIYILKDEKIIKKLTTDNGFSGNVVFKIMQDKNKVFWICTGSGITRYENETVCNFNSSNGLGSDSVFQMLIDDSDVAWMVSNRGISSVELSDMNDVAKGVKQGIDCKFYTQNDGLKSSGATSTALSMKDKFGRIWFTMADGFAVYDPLKLNAAIILPLLQVEYVNIDEVKITDFSAPIVIPAGAKHIDIKYTGLSFTASERNRFIHKMEGFDTDYSDPIANRTVSYTNLSPGKYTFYVSMMNGEGVFSENPGVIEFIQKPFIYQRKIFWISITAFIILGIFIGFYSVNRINKKRQLLLETKIQMATVELQMAKDDSDRLLKNILPVSIAERMKGIGGEKTIADTYENVTVLFSDIVGFTNKTGNSSAEDIVSSLNDLISRFDRRAASMGVEKIKTIGDAYMAACGVPEKNSKHSVIMLKFAMGMYKDLAEYNKKAKIKFNIRIGLNSGKVVAGVIGKNKFIYDIWGDTVNVASRMESNCNPGHIRFTESVKKSLEENHVRVKCREEMIDVKGKGLMKTFEIPE